MNKIKKTIVFLIMFLVLIPGFVSAKVHTNSVSKDVFLSGGNSLTSAVRIDNNYKDNLKVINKSAAPSTVLSGMSSVGYYINGHSPSVFTSGSYGFSISNGTDSDLDFSILYKRYLKIGDKQYDVKLSIDKVYNVNSGIIYISEDNLNIEVDDSTVLNNGIASRYHGLDMELNIYEAGTSKKANIKDLVISISDLDGKNDLSEGIKVDNFIPGFDNTFVTSYDSTLNYNNGSIYGLRENSEFLGGKGDVFFKSDSLQNSGNFKFSYATSMRNVGIFLNFLLPYHKVEFNSTTGGKILGSDNVDVFDDDSIESPEKEALDGYKFTYWTCNKDVEVGSKLIKANETIDDNQLREIKVKEDLIFTAHYDLFKYNLTTFVINGNIDASQEVYYGESKSISYVPKEGYHLESIKVDGKEINIEDYPTFYIFEKINEDHSIEVIFAINKYNITTKVEGGIIDESREVSYGDNVEINYSPLEGYRLYSVKVDGVLVDYPKYYEFNNVKEDHVIEVIYELIPEIKINKTSDKDNYKEGDVIKYKINLIQKIDGAVLRGAILEDYLPSGTILDTESLEKNDDIEVLAIDNNYFKIKIGEIKTNKTILYDAIVKDNLNIDTLINKVAIDDLNEKLTVNKTVYIPRGKIIKQSLEKSAVYNDIITYSIRVNQLTNGACFHNNKIIDELPYGLSLIEAKSNIGKVNTSGNKIEVNLDSLSNKELIITIKAKVYVKNGDIRNVAIFNSDELKYPLESASLIKVKRPSLSISKRSNLNKVKVGDKIKYNILVKGSNAREVYIKDRLPKGVKLINNTLKTSGKVKIKDNEIDIYFDKLDDKTFITYEVNALEVGKAINSASIHCSNYNKELSVSNKVKIGKEIKKDNIKISIPNTLKNKEKRFEILIICTTVILCVIAIFIIVKK